jgi:hypothetical protein
MIGTEIALNFVKALCGNTLAKDMEEAKKETEFLVVINANPGSRALVENGEYCRRVSPDNVDINRNFDVQWDKADKGDADTNPGKSAFDQPESRILKQLMAHFQPHAYLDLHSGFKGMFFPNQVANDKALSTKLQRLVAPVDESTCNCPLGVANEAVGYHTAGSALDYSFSVLNVPFAMAVEVFIGKRKDAKELEDRWNAQKKDLLKPIMTGSSFLENGIAADTVIPMSLIESGDQTEQSPEAINCLNTFNPTNKLKFTEIIDKWTNALAQLSIKSRQIPANAAIEAIRMSKEKGMSFRQKIEEPQQEEVPVWIAVKALGLLLVVYIGMKYYNVKQSKSAEAAPLNVQMSPVQISD